MRFNSIFIPVTMLWYSVSDAISIPRIQPPQHRQIGLLLFATLFEYTSRKGDLRIRVLGRGILEVSDPGGRQPK